MSDKNDFIKDIMQLKYSENFAISGMEEANINLSLNTVDNKSCSITGIVTDGTNPVSDATVKLFDSKGIPFQHTLTNNNGQYDFDNIPAGAYSIAAVKTGYYLSSSKTVTLSEGNSIEKNFAITPDLTVSLGTVAGIVKDINNKPLDGVNCTLFNEAEEAVSVTYSVDDGEFTFYDIKDGSYTIIGNASGYMPSAPMAVVVKGNIINIQLILEIDSRVFNGTVSGIIRDSKNNVVANAFVGLYQIVKTEDRQTEQLVAVMKTNANGAYLFGNVIAGKYVVKSKMAKTYATTTG